MSSEQEFVAAKEPTAPFEISTPPCAVPGCPSPAYPGETQCGYHVRLEVEAERLTPDALAAQAQRYLQEPPWTPPLPSWGFCRNSIARPPKETGTVLPNRADRRAAQKGR